MDSEENQPLLDSNSLSPQADSTDELIPGELTFDEGILSFDSDFTPYI